MKSLHFPPKFKPFNVIMTKMNTETFPTLFSAAGKGPLIQH